MFYLKLLFKLNTKAFTLTEVMMSVGVLGIIALIGSGASQMILKSAKTADRVSEQVTLANDISSLLSDAKTCTELLVGQKSAEANEISLGLDIQRGQKYSGKVEIQMLQLKNIKAITDTSYRADIVLKGAKIGDVIGSKDFTKTFRVYYKVNETQQIESCLGESVDAASSCAVLGGVWVDLARRCDFCATLGGEWQNQKCMLPQASSDISQKACEPELYSVTTKSAPSANQMDACDKWELPIFNSTLTYLNRTLRKKPLVKDEDYQAVVLALKEFYTTCITGEGVKEPSCQRAATSGVVNWSYSLVSTSKDSATAGLSRCAVNLMVATQFCR